MTRSMKCLLIGFIFGLIIGFIVKNNPANADTLLITQHKSLSDGTVMIVDNADLADCKVSLTSIKSLSDYTVITTKHSVLSDLKIFIVQKKYLSDDGCVGRYL